MLWRRRTLYTYSVAGSKFDGFFFLWKNMKEQLDALPIRTTEDLLAKYQVAVTTDDSNV
jgi:hypothetical protein